MFVLYAFLNHSFNCDESLGSYCKQVGYCLKKIGIPMEKIPKKTL